MTFLRKDCKKIVNYTDTCSQSVMCPAFEIACQHKDGVVSHWLCHIAVSFYRRMPQTVLF